MTRALPLVALLGLLVATPAASAGTATSAPYEGVRFRVEPGERVDLDVSVDPDGRTVRFRDALGPVVAGRGCETVLGETVCTLEQTMRVGVRLSGAADRVTAGGAGGTPVFVDPGGGPDRVVARDGVRLGVQGDATRDRVVCLGRARVAADVGDAVAGECGRLDHYAVTADVDSLGRHGFVSVSAGGWLRAWAACPERLAEDAEPCTVRAELRISGRTVSRTRAREAFAVPLDGLRVPPRVRRRLAAGERVDAVVGVRLLPVGLPARVPVTLVADRAG